MKHLYFSSSEAAPLNCASAYSEEAIIAAQPDVRQAPERAGKEAMIEGRTTATELVSRGAKAVPSGPPLCSQKRGLLGQKLKVCKINGLRVR
jgi:hypothetical protein